MVTAIIAEDEAPLRQELRRELQLLWPELAIVAECEDGIAALAAVAAERPQVAFLDIRMPGVSGLDVARTVAAAKGLVVFTTAYDEYTLRAFEAGAVDYLMKPIQRERLRLTLDRVRERLSRGAPAASVEELESLEQRLRPSGTQRIRWISAAVGSAVRLIGIDEVLFFQAQDKYVRVVTERDDAVIRRPIKELLAGLDPDEFWQVHRGVIVRVSAIDRLHKDELGKSELVLRASSERLPVSQAFLHRFRGM